MTEESTVVDKHCDGCGQDYRDCDGMEVTPITDERLREVVEKVWDSAQQYSQEESFLEITAILRALVNEAR